MWQGTQTIRIIVQLVIQALKRVFQLIGLVDENVWPRGWHAIIDYYGDFFNQVNRNRFFNDLFLFSVPVFTRDGVHDLIVYTVVLETAKVFWIVGLLLLIVAKFNLFKSYKIQADDHVQWKKLPKVRFGCKSQAFYGLLELIDKTCILDLSERVDESFHRWTDFLQIQFLSHRTC